MTKHGKNYNKISEKLDEGKLFSIEEAVAFLKDNVTVKFDPTAEIAFRLGVDPKKSDQMVRGTVALPHGTGKEVRIIVFATGPAADAASEAGALEVGMDELIAKVADGWLDFDVVVATPEAMKQVRKLGKVLGPRGLMPNPKSGTVTDDTASAIEQLKAGRVEFKMDRQGNVMLPFGKMSFEKDALVENCQTVIEAVVAAKPVATKGVYVRKCTVTSTMGPGLTIDQREIGG